MRLLKPVVRALSLMLLAGVSRLGLPSAGWAQNASRNAVGDSAPPTLIQQMAGTWNVRQRMWPGPGADATDLAPAIAHRRLVEGVFVEEVMESVEKGGPEPFTRTSYFNYNAVTRQYEYFSLDSRLPQMMNERSKSSGPVEPGTDGIKLHGGRFVAPRWGDATNVEFTYRLTMGEIRDDRQIVHLYLTPRTGREFLAFEYVYSRQH
jgi:Protein of unknown function (DUF1579)